MPSALDDLRESIVTRQDEAILGADLRGDELTLSVTLAPIVDFLSFLKTDATCRFSTLIDVTAVDWPTRERRFDVVYHLLSMTLNQRVRVKVAVREDEIVPSITPAFAVANWYEREIFDMYGIMFSGHPDLRRLLTDYGFRGHPLRKDFPTTGYVELRYDEEQKRVVYEPVQLTQEYRQFDFMSPWEGAEYVMPDGERIDSGMRGGNVLGRIEKKPSDAGGRS